MLVREKTKLSLQIWDSSGDLKMQNLGRTFCKNADALILVFDITSRESFDALDTYWENYISFSDTEEPDEFPALLVGESVLIISHIISLIVHIRLCHCISRALVM
jgi:GTPase SAR1 family protein